MSAPMPVGLVDCHDCPETHRAEYRGRNEHGQDVWAVVCGEYVERYTAEAVRPLPPARGVTPGSRVRIRNGGPRDGYVVQVLDVVDDGLGLVRVGWFDTFRREFRMGAVFLDELEVVVDEQSPAVDLRDAVVAMPVAPVVTAEHLAAMRAARDGAIVADRQTGEVEVEALWRERQTDGRVALFLGAEWSAWVDDQCGGDVAEAAAVLTTTLANMHDGRL